MTPLRRGLICLVSLPPRFGGIETLRDVLFGFLLYVVPQFLIEFPIYLLPTEE